MKRSLWINSRNSKSTPDTFQTIWSAKQKNQVGFHDDKKAKRFSFVSRRKVLCWKMHKIAAWKEVIIEILCNNISDLAGSIYRLISKTMSKDDKSGFTLQCFDKIISLHTVEMIRDNSKDLRNKVTTTFFQQSFCNFRTEIGRWNIEFFHMEFS